MGGYVRAGREEWVGGGEGVKERGKSFFRCDGLVGL